MEHFGAERGVPAGMTPFVMEDSHGTIWAATSPGGLVRYRDGRFETLDKRLGLPNNSVRALAEDREGSLWVGTNGGLARLRDLKFTNYTMRHGLAEDNVRVVTETRNGDLWVGTGAGGVNLIRDGSVVAHGPWEALSNLPIRSLAEDLDGALWIGTGDGVRRLHEGHISVEGEGEGLKGVKVDALFVTRDGTLFVASESGLWKRQGARFEPAAFPGAATPKNVRIFLEDRQGSLWLGTLESGLFEIREGLVRRHLTVKDGLPSNIVFALHEDKGGALWIGTHDGLGRLENGRITFVTSRSGLPDDTVFQLLDDGLGSFWLTSNSGITRVSRTSLEAVLDGRASRVDARSFGKADGMGSRQCNGATQPAGTKLRDGRLAIPTAGGLTMVDPADLHINRVPPPIILSGVLLDGKPIDQESQAKLPWQSKRFEFRYEGLSLLLPELVTYRYRIDGLDDDWIDVGTRRVAVYNSLPPGHHVFRVQARNSDGFWSVGEARYAFDLPSPPWRRWWAVLLYVTAILGTAAAALRLRESVYRRRTEVLEARVHERTAELAQALERMEASEAQAVEANRAKSIFLASMSHELRTPLNAVLGFSQLLERDPAIEGESREGLQIIQRSGEHLLGLINDVLSISKIEAGKLSLAQRPFDLLELLLAVKSMIKVRAESKGLEVAFEVDLALPRGVMGDDGKLRQVLINLLGNAVKFTAHGRVTLRARWKDGRAGFEVEDTGPGIAPEELGRLFEAFTQTETGKEAREGTGLGLAISRQIVRLMGGEIEAESEPGRGTAFRFQVDLPEAELQAPQELKRVKGLAFGQKAPHILVVDDTDENRILLTRLLRSTGFSVREAANGQQAIEEWQHSRPDAIFMDMRMPVMDGREASRRIRELEGANEATGHSGHRTVILALTASAFDHEREEILSSGADDFLVKPFRVEMILEKLARHLEIQYRYETATNGEPPSRTLTHPGLDVDAGLHRAGGNADLYWRLVRNLVLEGSGYLRRLERLVPEGERTEALHLLHTVKGTAGTLGATRFAGAAAALEARLKKTPGARVSLDALGELREALDEVRRALPSPVTSAEETGTAPPRLDVTRARTALAIAGRLTELLAAGDLEAINCIAELEKSVGPDLGRPLGELRASVDLLDFETASSRLAAIRSTLAAACEDPAES
jgi:signal transduction histidine kinase/CheY-like chemotaxis protein/HPt (histidine-containing phosphotransfer) domain-containing protein